MKKVALVLVVLVALLVSVASASANGPLAMANLSATNWTADDQCEDFHVGAAGNWGGRPNERAVAAFPDEDSAGYCTFTWGAGMGKARHIELEVLDGIADDSFEVYVKNPAGTWVLVYSYSADPSTTEVWKPHHIYSFPAGKGQGSTVELKIVPTNVGWSGYNTYGQLAVDYIALYEH